MTSVNRKMLAAEEEFVVFGEDRFVREAKDDHEKEKKEHNNSENQFATIFCFLLSILRDRASTSHFRT